MLWTVEQVNIKCWIVRVFMVLCVQLLINNNNLRRTHVVRTQSECGGQLINGNKRILPTNWVISYEVCERDGRTNAPHTHTHARTRTKQSYSFDLWFCFAAEWNWWIRSFWNKVPMTASPLQFSHSSAAESFACISMTKNVMEPIASPFSSIQFRSRIKHW